MSDATTAWYYDHMGSSKGPFTPDEIRALIRADVLNEHTSVWSELIGEWKPLFRTDLRSLLGERTIQPPPLSSGSPAAPKTRSDEEALASLFDKPGSTSALGTREVPAQLPGVSPYAFASVRDNKFLGKALTWLVALNGGISAFEALTIIKASGGVSGKYQQAAFLDTQDVAALVAIPFLITIVVFLLWKYRSTSNLIALRGPQSVSAAGAVYWYFIPVAWFWKPYQAMRNIALGFGAGPVSAVQKWWAFTLASVFVPLVANASLPDQVTTIEQAQRYIGWSIAIYGVEVAWCYFAAELIKSVNASQSRALGQS
ncbi:hypothetical protein GCM10011390_44230 [Aureimonas endophytica]|uniref:GYF domain-containing protein n=1 Tax=Aureimonas endophytica TaxID=2027858 RepID=A0A917A0S0_9HYPH|nr:DUF4328 domain-containing protein [Aureimonas endophytica]GGE20142.1 hypothetical protein GCM10011390_44230 [Aureimonas endophytica]